MDAGDGRGPFGVIIYPRPLSKNEIEQWELRMIDMPRLNYYIYGVHENGNQEFLMKWAREVPGVFDAALERANKLGRIEEFVDFVVQPVLS